MRFCALTQCRSPSQAAAIPPPPRSTAQRAHFLFCLFPLCLPPHHFLPPLPTKPFGLSPGVHFRRRQAIWQASTGRRRVAIQINNNDDDNTRAPDSTRSRSFQWQLSLGFMNSNSFLRLTVLSTSNFCPRRRRHQL